MRAFTTILCILALIAAALYFPINAWLSGQDEEFLNNPPAAAAMAVVSPTPSDGDPGGDPSLSPSARQPVFEDMPHYRAALSGRYAAYLELNPAMSVYDVVTYVNIGLDYPFYENIQEIENPDDILVLCNKYNKLKATYVPGDLALTGGRTLKKEARDAFDAMKKAAQEAGCDLYISNSYRSYDSQKSYYDLYVKNEKNRGADAGEAIAQADEYSARPGHSEHQTALTFDLRIRGSTGSLSSLNYEETKEYAWLIENAHIYGYILRYPKGYENITGYTYEPWHWRYIGPEAAAEMRENGIATFDEYIATRPVD